MPSQTIPDTCNGESGMTSNVIRIPTSNQEEYFSEEDDSVHEIEMSQENKSSEVISTSTSSQEKPSTVQVQPETTESKATTSNSTTEVVDVRSSVTNSDSRSELKLSTAAERKRPKAFASSRYATKLTLTKRTGDVFPLPLGGSIWFEEGAVSRKETVMCQAVLPDQRRHLAPDTKPGEQIVSEIYTFDCKQRRLRTRAVIEIPFHTVDERYRLVELRQQNSKTGYWASVEFEIVDRCRARLSSTDLGSFCVVACAKSDSFTIPVDGCLHTCRHNRYITMRIPKRAAEYDLSCTMRSEQLRPRLAPLVVKEHFKHCRHLLTASDIHHFELPSDFSFKRKVTIKLPLPPPYEPAADEEPVESSVAVMQEVGEKWQLVPVNDYRITRTTVAFDVFKVTRFCVLRVKQGREVLSEPAAPVIAAATQQRAGHLLAWLLTEPDRWILRLEWLQPHLRSKIMKIRTEKESFQLLPESERELSTYDCSEIGAEFDADFSVPDLDGVYDDGKFTTHHSLDENFKDYYLEPGAWSGGAQSGSIKLSHEPPSKAALIPGSSGKFAHTISMSVGVEVVRARYQRVWEQERRVKEAEAAELELQRMKQLQLEQEEEQKQREEAARLKREAAQIARFDHVPSKVKQYISNDPTGAYNNEKEIKVLSSRSLRALASSIQRESLTLGVYLGLPQAKIQALGVDALSSGLNPVDVAYRLLVMWKRNTPRVRQVDDLLQALEQLNRSDIANVVRQKNERQIELTADSLPRAVF